MTNRNGFTARRPPNSANGGDSIGCARAESVLPIRRRDAALLSDVHATDLYLRGTRKMVVKWHDGFHVLEAREYRGYWTVRVQSAGETPWLAAVDVDMRTKAIHRVRGIGSTYMAFVHKTRTQAEITIDRYRHIKGER